MPLFFAALPGPEVRRRFESAVEALGLPPDARRVAPENYHMTVAFAGEVSHLQSTSLRTRGAGAGPVAFEISCSSWEY